jgi:hypothetical protein
MTLKIDGKRILAIAVRRSCFGYAAFIGPKQLFDWGTTSPYPLQHATSRAKKRFLSILRSLPPEIIVIQRPRRGSRGQKILKFIKNEAEASFIPLVFVSPSRARATFSRANNKDDIAEALTAVFPELLFKLPPKRRTGDSERHVMIVFDAVAIGFTYLQRPSEREPPPI